MPLYIFIYIYKYSHMHKYVKMYANTYANIRRHILASRSRYTNNLIFTHKLRHTYTQITPIFRMKFNRINVVFFSFSFFVVENLHPVRRLQNA